MLEIKNLHANINGKEILKGINLTVKAGEVHAHSPSSFLIQSYPFSSSSNASSGPAVFTIRPL
jgi:hypothetical protein